MTDNIPTDGDIEGVIERIENGEWEVTDFNLDAGMYEMPTVVFEVEYTPEPEYDTREAIRSVRQIVERVGEEFDKGAPIEEVVERGVNELDIDRASVEHELEKLKKQGEVYEPNTNYLRST